MVIAAVEMIGANDRRPAGAAAPCEPAFGCNEIAANPVISHRRLTSSSPENLLVSGGLRDGRGDATFKIPAR